MKERTRSLDAYAETLADVGNDGFYDFVDRAISDQGNMEAMFSLKAGDGRSTEDDMADREPNPSFRQRLKRTVMNLAGRLISAMMLKRSRDRTEALDNAKREHREGVEAGKRRFLAEYGDGGADIGSHGGRGREME